MFAYNGVKVNMIDTGNPFVKDYLEKVKRIKEAGIVFAFRYQPRLIRPKDPFDPESKEGKPSGIEIKWTQRYQFGEHSGEVTYYESTRYDANGKDVYSPKVLDFTGAKDFEIPRDIEKIFFLIYVNQFIEFMDDFPGQNGIRNKKVYMVLEQKDVVIRKALELEETILKARSLVFGEHALSVKKLQTLGRVLNYHGIENCSEDELRYMFTTDLFAMSRGKYDEKKIRYFLEVATEEKAQVFPEQTGPTREYVATDVIDTVRSAVSVKVVTLVFDRKLQKKFWRYTQSKVVICNVGVQSSDEQALSVLIDHFSQSEKDLVALRAEVAAEVE
jgi:hypothetical protein